MALIIVIRQYIKQVEKSKKCRDIDATRKEYIGRIGFRENIQNWFMMRNERKLIP